MAEPSRGGSARHARPILRSLRQRERRRRVAETLELVGLGEVADRKVKKLSGGMVRRLGVAQAMVHEPAVLIVDEPTVGWTPKNACVSGK